MGVFKNLEGESGGETGIKIYRVHTQKYENTKFTNKDREISK